MKILTGTRNGLKWDRTREGAEVMDPNEKNARAARFNGTAPVKVRKYVTACSGNDISASFNGTAPVKVRKSLMDRYIGVNVFASMGPHP